MEEGIWKGNWGLKKKEFRDTDASSVVWIIIYNCKLANQNARLVPIAIVNKNIRLQITERSKL